VAPWPMARRAQSRTILHQSLKSFFLRDLGDERNPLCLHACGNGRRRAGDGETGRATLADGGGSIWWSSDSGEGFDGGGGNWWPSKMKFGVEHSLEAGQQQRLCSVLAMGTNC
jgi:hypothetical protein